MADFPCAFVNPATFPEPWVRALPRADPVNYGAVLMPLVVNPSAPPEITDVSPPPGALGRFQPISFRLTDDIGAYALRELWIRFGIVTSYDLVYDGASFLAPYAASSQLTAVPNGWAFTLLRDGGWPPGKVGLRATVLDAEGHMVVIDA